ncbi:MAG TPA: hypothetical protein PK821_06820 [Victivallales bacterium]|nr:hypothetical protein [Victivallales bacterium]
MKIFCSICVLFAVISFSGCTSVVGISPSTTPITENDTYTIIGKASGTSRGILWFVIPTFPDSPSKTARDKAIRDSGADALIEVVEEYEVFNMLVLGFVWTTVEGTAVKITRGGASQ